METTYIESNARILIERKPSKPMELSLDILFNLKPTKMKLKGGRKPRQS